MLILLINLLNFYSSYVHALLVIFSSLQPTFKLTTCYYTICHVSPILQLEKQSHDLFQAITSSSGRELRIKFHVLKLMFCNLIIQIQQFTVR